MVGRHIVDRSARAAAGLLAMATVSIACTGSQGTSPQIASARIERVSVSPDRGGIVFPGSELAVEMEYSIETAGAGRENVYFAVVEISSTDQHRLFLDACGGRSRQSLPEARGQITLSCRMRLDPYRQDQDTMLMRVRIYQRTDPHRSVMLASSEASVFHLRVPAIEPWQRVFMDRCPSSGQRDGAVVVCRT